MTVGIPGAGIGGLFYLASALVWMPAAESWALVRGRSDALRRALVVRQLLTALGILAAMGGTAWLVETALAISPWLMVALGLHGSGQDLPRVLTASALWIGVSTLTTVYVTTHAARLVARKRPVLGV